jgi:hypothetical protein
MNMWLAQVVDTVNSWGFALVDRGSDILAAPAPTPAPSGGGKVKNPMDGITPDMSVLGTAFGSVWARIAGAIWALLLGAATLYFGAGWLTLAQAKKMGNSHMMADATGDLRLRAVAVGGLVALPLLMGAIIAVIG